MRRLWLSIFILFFIVPLLPGQDSLPLSNQTGDISLNIRSLNFIKNNEYFNPINVSPFTLTSNLPWPVDKSLWTEGYTLTGFFLQPELVYKASDRMTLRAGVHLLKYSGANKFASARPMLAASLALTKNTVLTLGSLSGSDKHRMFDPNFERERSYVANAEDGLELLTKSDRVFNDVWINWQNFIFRNDTTRETFTFGESFQYTTKPIADYLTIDIPLQIQFKHFGGQISNYPEHVTTFFNFASGIRFNIEPGDGNLGKASLEYLLFLNKVIPAHDNYILSHGDAWWIRFNYVYKSLNAGFSYWNANDFYAPEGNTLYASVFRFNSDYIIHNRELLTGSLFLNFKPDSFVKILFGIEAYYDIQTKYLDHAMTLHIDFEKLFRIANIK